MTLLEVLVALSFSAVLVGCILRFYGQQLFLAEQIYWEGELQNSLLRSGQVVSHALQTAQKVELRSGGVVRITSKPYGEETVIDSYYIGDKDNDGIPDLYRERAGVPGPLSSYIVVFECRKIQDGFWEVILEAAHQDYRLAWSKRVRQGGWCS